LKTKSLRQDKVNVITLGCSKNIVDSENLITQLAANDFEVFHEKEDSDANIVVVNTCGFIDLAKKESIDTILHYAKLKSEGSIEKLYVTGCLSQRYKEELEAEIPEVDAFFGSMELPGLLAKFNANYQHELIGERMHSTPMHYAYMKISEGCNRTCSFCAIPLMRGNHVSRSIDDLVKEARHLAQMGVKEIMLIAQELTYYGLDLYKKRELATLLRELNDVDGIEWIRLHYAYPTKFPLEIMDAMAALPHVCNYLDMPIQHANDAVLSRMKRQITQQETRQLIQDCRSIVPDLTLRTTTLVGFPGETKKEFEDLVNFANEIQFDRLGVFQYSHEEDTSAHLFKDNVSRKEKERRANELMEVQREISTEKNQNKIGKTLKVLFDRKEGEYFIGRTEGDSPEVDNEVLVDANEQFVRIGDFAMVHINDANEFDLFGDIVSS